MGQALLLLCPVPLQLERIGAEGSVERCWGGLVPPTLEAVPGLGPFPVPKCSNPELINPAAALPGPQAVLQEM